MNSNNKIGLGVILEKWAYAVLKSIFKASESFRIKHINWNNYSYGHGLDLKVFKGSSQILGIECKNWRDFDRPYGTNIAVHEIIDRFANFAGGIKVLVITFLSLLTKEALRLLQTHKIHVIEIGKLIGKLDFPRKGRNSKVFYQLKGKLAKLWFGAKFGHSSHNVCSYNRLDTYRSDTTHENTSHNTTPTITIKHDTDSRKLPNNRAIELVKQVIRDKQRQFLVSG